MSTVVGTAVSLKDAFVEEGSHGTGVALLADAEGNALSTTEHLASVPLLAAPALSPEALRRAKTVRVSYFSPSHGAAVLSQNALSSGLGHSLPWGAAIRVSSCDAQAGRR